MSDVVNTEVESTGEDTEQTEVNTEETEGQEQGTQEETVAKPKVAAVATQTVTKKDQTEIDQVVKFIETQGLPKEIKYFKDKSGKLQFQVPIDGKNYTMDLAGIVKGFNLNQAGYKKLEEGKAIEKKFNGWVEHLKTHPEDIWKFVKELGHDDVKLAHSRLQKQVELDSMTEEQRELAKFKEERERFEQEKEKHNKTLEEQKIEAASKQHGEKYSKDLIAALAKQGISKDSASFRSMKGITRMAVEKVKAALSKNVDMSMEDAVLEAKQDIDANIQDFLMSVDDDHIIDALPPEFVNRILKASLKKKVVTPTTGTIGKHVELKEGNSVKNKNKKQSVGDYFNSL
jgi:hypothetical protein